MLIPSIDLQGGRIVQLVQGERLAVESTDISGWIDRFRRFPAVQLIDLDAAKNEGDNALLVRRICGELPCRVGGGIRTVERARSMLSAGASKVILGSSLFSAQGVNLAFAESAAEELGIDRIIAAIDGKQGRVAIHGWRTLLDLTPVQAAQALEAYAGEFLYTNVDVEGLMKGLDRASIEAVKAATSRRLTAAGGVTTEDDVAWLESIGVDAVAGMAIYTGRLKI